MHIFALALLLQAISPPEPPPLSHYTAGQGAVVVVQLDSQSCAAGPVAVLDRSFTCRPDTTVIVGIPADAYVGTHWFKDTHSRSAAALEVTSSDFRGTRKARTPRPLSRRREREVARLKAAYAVHEQEWPAERRLRAPLVLPVAEDYRITDRFGPNHTAVDIAAAYEGGWARHAPDARSVAHGRVVLSERLSLEGNVVIVYHGDAVYTAYCHLRKRAVKVGKAVEAGTVLGRIGATGAADGVHLHMTMRIHGVGVDPLAAITTLNNSRFLKP